MIFSISCSKRPQQIDVNSLPITIEIIPEDTLGGYALVWNDTLCPEFSDSPRFLEERPYELYCYIINNQNDTLGKYTGLSSPRQFTYFQTKNTNDSLINLHFIVGINHFSRFLQRQPRSYIEQFNQNNKAPVVFNTIPLNINDGLRIKKDIFLECKPKPKT